MEARKKALQILSELTPLRIEKQPPRTRCFIASPTADPTPNLPPRNWPEGWCCGWAYAVQPAFADAMDIRLVPRSKTEKVLDVDGRPIQKCDTDGNLLFKKNGRPEYEAIKTTWQEWSQGSVFDFREGAIIHDAPEAWTLPWGEALKYIKYSLKVVDAIPVSPASPTGNTARFGGEVTFQIYRPNAECTALELYGEPVTVSQDDFVRILITGNLHTQE